MVLVVLTGFALLEHEPDGLRGANALRATSARALPHEISIKKTSFTNERPLPAWWLLRGAYTRSHSELGRENPQRRWYSGLSHGRVGRCQACRARSKSSLHNPLPPISYPASGGFIGIHNVFTGAQNHLTVLLKCANRPNRLCSFLGSAQPRNLDRSVPDTSDLDQSVPDWKEVRHSRNPDSSVPNTT